MVMRVPPVYHHIARVQQWHESGDLLIDKAGGVDSITKRIGGLFNR